MTVGRRWRIQAATGLRAAAILRLGGRVGALALAVKEALDETADALADSWTLCLITAIARLLLVSCGRGVVGGLLGGGRIQAQGEGEARDQ